MKVQRLLASAQEECGVWLDTAELRRKRKAILLPRRISRLLNPLAPTAGYCIPAAVSFTQTTRQFPVTKQSSITNFLSPRCHEKKGAEPAAVIDPPSSATQRKRKRFDEAEEPSNQSAWDAVMGSQALLPADLGGGATEGSRRPGICGDEEGEEEPVRKRPWNNTEGTQGPHMLPHCTQGPNTAETLGPNTAETLGPHTQSHGTAETKRPHTRSHCTSGPQTLSCCSEEKENDRRHPWLPPSSPFSPRSSSWRRESSWLSPQKRPLHDLRETEAQSLKLLFTQDSEGRRVIAHPAAANSSPLKDRTNSSAGAERPWSVPLRPLTQGESDSVFKHCSDLLFTQDSEGNRVMKH